MNWVVGVIATLHGILILDVLVCYALLQRFITYLNPSMFFLTQSSSSFISLLADASESSIASKSVALTPDLCSTSPKSSWIFCTVGVFIFFVSERRIDAIRREHCYLNYTPIHDFCQTKNTTRMYGVFCICCSLFCFE